MARTGRPPKPIEQKRKTGNPGRRPLPSVANIAAVPAITAELHDLSTGDAMSRVLEAGVSWIASTDSPKVALLREAIEDYELLRSGAPTPKDLREARAEIGRLMSELGFDPTARARLGLAEVKAQSKLEEMRARRNSSTVAAEVAEPD